MKEARPILKRIVLVAALLSLWHYPGRLALGQEKQKPDLCELVINLKDAPTGGFATLYLLQKGGETFVPLEVPISTTSGRLSSAQYKRLDEEIAKAQGECVDDFFAFPLHGTENLASKTDRIVAYLQRIDPQVETLRVGINRPADGEVRYFSGLASQWQVETTALKEFNDVEDIGDPGLDPLFHPDKSIKVGIIFISDTEIAEPPTSDGLVNAGALLPVLSGLPDRVDPARLREYVVKREEETDAGDGDDTSGGGSGGGGTPFSMMQWLITVQGLIGNFLRNPLLHAYVLGGITLLAILGFIDIRRDLHQISRVRTVALARRINPFRNERLRSFDDAVLFFEWQENVLIQFMEAIDRSLNVEGDGGFYTLSEGKKHLTCANREAFRKKFENLASSLRDQAKEVRLNTLKEILSRFDSFDSQPAIGEKAGESHLMDAFTSFNQQHQYVKSTLAEEKQKSKGKEKALSRERIRVEWHGKVLAALHKAVDERALRGTDSWDGSLSQGRKGLTLRTGGEENLEAERKKLEGNCDRFIGYLDWIDERRKAVAEADEADRKEMATQMAEVASAVRESFAVEDWRTDLKSTPIPAESAGLLKAIRAIAAEARKLQRSLEEIKEERQLRRVVYLGSKASRHLHEAVKTTESQGITNVLLELVREEVHWINQYINRLDERLSMSSGKVVNLMVASDLMFSDEQATGSLPSALRITAAIRVLRGYKSIWNAQPQEVQKSLLNAERCIERMLTILGVVLHDQVRLPVDVGTLTKKGCKFKRLTGSRLLEDPLFQTEIGGLYAKQKITPRSTVIDVTQLGFEVTGPSQHKGPWDTVVFVADEQDLQRYSRLRAPVT